MSQPAPLATQAGESIMDTSAQLASFGRPCLLREIARNKLSRTKSGHELRREIRAVLDQMIDAVTSEEHRRHVRMQLIEG